MLRRNLKVIRSGTIAMLEDRDGLRLPLEALLDPFSDGELVTVAVYRDGGRNVLVLTDLQPVEKKS